MSSFFVAADERFYTTVDAQGHVQLIKSESAKLPSAAPLPTKTVVTPTKEPTKDLSSQDGKRQVDSEIYIDTEQLEKKKFNLDDKKRFYYLPDGGLGTPLIESSDGVISKPSETIKLERPVSYVSSNYLSLSKKEILGYYVQQAECFDKSLISKKSKPFKNINNIWVQPSFLPNTLEMDGLLHLSTEANKFTQMRIASFASTLKKSSFYLPVVVFLDFNGCVLSGAWQYWSRAHAATDTQYASVDGLIDVPIQAVYVLFYRPNNTLKADIPLSLESGSFVVEAY